MPSPWKLGDEGIPGPSSLASGGPSGAVARRVTTDSVAEEEDALLGEGHASYAEAGVSFDELYAEGYFDCVTDAHRTKARAYFAKIDAKRNPPPQQADLFS